MRDEDKSRDQLIRELRDIRQRIVEYDSRPKDSIPPTKQAVAADIDERSSVDDFNERPEFLQSLRLDEDPTESIDLSALFKREMTESGSFDIRGNIWATTFGKVMQALPIPAMLIDPLLSVIVANEACGKLCKDYVNILDSPFSDLFPNSRAGQKAESLLETVFTDRKPRLGEAIMEIDKKRIHARLSFRSIRIRTKRFVLVLIEDLTPEKEQITLIQKHRESLKKEIVERKQMEEELQIRATVLESMIEGVVMTDSKGMISFSNPAFDEMFGFKRGELNDQNISILNGYSAEENARIIEEISEQLKTKGAWFGEILNVRKDGSKFYTYARISALEISGKEYWISVQEDITDRKRAEDALREAKRTSQSADEAKSQFLANMSHELRNPLNSIIGFSEILDRRTYGELNSRQSRYVSHILDSGRHLLDLVNGMFALAQVESGKAELELSDVSLPKLLDDSLSWIKPGAAKRELNLDLIITEELTHTMIRADAGKLKQIMFYLLSHAVKSTPDKGDIKVSARREGEDIFISVSDTGAGLESSDLELIFVPFDHADFPRARKQQGAGLGLSLAKLLSELHGGRLWAESEGPGKGSTFTFVIPYIEAAKPQDSTST